MPINFSAIKQLIFQYCNRNIKLFSIASCKVIALKLLCLNVWISSLLTLMKQRDSERKYYY